jgi:hypothetical protein
MVGSDTRTFTDEDVYFAYSQSDPEATDEQSEKAAGPFGRI